MEEILISLFKSDNIYLYESDIIKKLNNYSLSEDEIEGCIDVLNHSELFINIDKYYQKTLSKECLKKLCDREKVRYIIRKKKKNKNIKKALLKLKISKQVIKKYLSDKQIKNDRYILNKENCYLKTKIVYKQKLYKIKNIYIIYNNEELDFCIRKIFSKENEIEFHNKKYYSDIKYEYYNIKDNQLINDIDKYKIIKMTDLKNMNLDALTISLLDIKSKIKSKLYEKI